MPCLGKTHQQWCILSGDTHCICHWKKKTGAGWVSTFCPQEKICLYLTGAPPALQVPPGRKGVIGKVQTFARVGSLLIFHRHWSLSSWRVRHFIFFHLFLLPGNVISVIYALLVKPHSLLVPTVGSSRTFGVHVLRLRLVSSQSRLLPRRNWNGVEEGEMEQRRWRCLGLSCGKTGQRDGAE